VSYAPTSSSLNSILSAARELKINVLVLSRRRLEGQMSALRDYLTGPECCVVLTP